jgi:MSHA biogenesis protein MshN
MSLINDMLRDLSNKQADIESNQIAVSDLQVVSWEQEKAAHFFQHSRLPLILISVGVFFVILFLLPLLLNQFGLSSEKLTPIPANHSEMVDQLVINSEVQSIPTSSSYVTTDLSNSQLQIYQLIDQASRAMVLDRLTSPDNDNAFYYYQQLLKLDSKNSIAITGMTKITDRYLQMAEMSIKKNDLAKAEFFIDKAAMVTPEDTRLTEYRNRSVVQAAQSILAGDIEEIRSVSPDLQSSISVSDPFNQSTNSVQENENPSASLSITPNPEILDKQIVTQSNELISQGFKSKAIELLENHILMYPAPASEHYLLDLYYQDKNLTAMQTLLNSNLAISAVEQIYYRARANILQGDNSSAINLLESNLSLATSNENYRALLAGLYQREQLYLQATSAYRNLLQGFKPKPAYWLGLALSLDAQNQSPAAIHAYQQVLQFEPLELQVREYAQNRIAQLSRDQH